MTSADRGRTVTMPELTWAVSPDDDVHAIEPGDLKQVNGSVETLCSFRPATEGFGPVDRLWGDLCFPCAAGAVADLPDPGRMGTVR